MPDLNFRNPTILKEMQNLARYWLDLGVDGFCIDAIKHVLESDSGLIAHTSENLAWVRDLERFIKSLKPDAYVVGETWTDTDTIARYHEQAGLDYSFNYPRVSALIGSV